jgi:hypothetical protein
MMVHALAKRGSMNVTTAHCVHVESLTQRQRLALATII